MVYLKLLMPYILLSLCLVCAPAPVSALVVDEPVIDKEKFSYRLDSLVDYTMKFDEKDVIEAIVIGDQEALGKVREEIIKCREKKEHFMALYNQAATDEEKQSIIESVSAGCEMP